MLKILSYPRSILVSLYTGVHTIVMSIVVLTLVALGLSRERVNAVIRFAWARFLLKLANVDVEVRGENNFGTGQKGFLVLFNHTSHIDILALYGHLPRAVCFGAKIELFKVPFFGRAMSAMGALPIDRRHKEKVLRLYEAAIPRLGNGEVFALAPEGTRQKEPKLGRFKFGPFLFAIQAQVNILPVVIAGAYDVLPKSSFWINLGAWKRRIVMEILPPVSTAGLADTDIELLQSRVHDQMSRALERLKPEVLGAQTTLVRNL